MIIEEVVMPKNIEYINKLKLEDFKQLLNTFDIHIDKQLQEDILKMIKNNSYAIVNDEYQMVLEESIRKKTSENTCLKFRDLFNNYFKPLIKV